MAGYYIEKIVLLLKNRSCRSEFAQVLMQAAGFWSVSGASPLRPVRSGQALVVRASGHIVRVVPVTPAHRKKGQGAWQNDWHSLPLAALVQEQFFQQSRRFVAERTNMGTGF